MNRLFVFLILLLALAPLSQAGPPFITDDPEPVEYKHWEIDIASQLSHDSDGWSGTAPHVEINYGAVPNLQLHIQTPLVFSSPRHETAKFGYGDTELGAKYRLFDESKYLPQVAIYPLVEVPTGNKSRDLGSGHPDIFIPIWLQKKYGKWTTYGGGGYWINPGPENRNWWFAGWLVQRQITPNLALGVEIFHKTANEREGSSSTDINAGGTWDLSETYHILFSAGHTVQGVGAFDAYLGLQITLGPEKPKEKAAK